MNTTVVLGVIAGNVAMMGLVVKVIGGRIDELVGATDRAEARADERHAAFLARFGSFD